MRHLEEIRNDFLFEPVPRSMLGQMGLSGKEIEELRADPHQIKKGGEPTGISVLNFLLRTGNYVPQNGDGYVSALLVAQRLGMNFSDILRMEVSGRKLVTEQQVGEVKDLCIAIKDIHLCVSPTTQYDSSPDIDQLATEYAQTRNPLVREQLSKLAMPIITRSARRLYKKINRKKDLDDLLSGAQMGLMGAMEKFDPSRGVKFTSYLNTRVSGAMLDELRVTDDMTRLDRSRWELLKTYEIEFREENKRSPTKDELGAYWNSQGCPPETFDNFYKTVFKVGIVQSLDKEVKGRSSDGKDVRRSDITHGDPEFEPVRKTLSRELMGLVQRDLTAIPAKYRRFFEFYLIDGETMLEAASKAGFSESRGSQVKTTYLGSPEFFKRTREYVGISGDVEINLDLEEVGSSK